MCQVCAGCRVQWCERGFFWFDLCAMVVGKKRGNNVQRSIRECGMGMGMGIGYGYGYGHELMGWMEEKEKKRNEWVCED